MSETLSVEFLRSFAGFSVKIFLVEFFAASVSVRTFSAAPCGVFLTLQWLVEWWSFCEGWHAPSRTSGVEA